MKVWNFDGVDEIKMGRDTITEVWFRGERVWRKPAPKNPRSWVDSTGTIYNLMFVFEWPDHNNYQMSLTVSDGANTVLASETSHYGTATDGSGELFIVRTPDRQNQFWVMIDGFERAWLYKQKGFSIWYRNVSLTPTVNDNEQLITI
jgi:hypothetical protein